MNLRAIHVITCALR